MKAITPGIYAPTTANGWLAILKVIMKAAKRELGSALFAISLWTDEGHDFRS